MATRRRRFLYLSAIVFGALALTAPLSFSQSNAPHVVGSWKGAVTPPTSPPGISPFTSLMTLTSDHTVIESRRLLLEPSPFIVLLETAGHGSWFRTDAGQFDIHFTFLLQSVATGADVGTDNVHLVLTLDPDGTTLTGTFESVKDPFRKSHLHRQRHLGRSADLADCGNPSTTCFVTGHDFSRAANAGTTSPGL